MILRLSLAAAELVADALDIIDPDTEFVAKVVEQMAVGLRNTVEGQITP